MKSTNTRSTDVATASQLLQWRREFLAAVGLPKVLEPLFDRLSDTVFSIKDVDGRYVLISESALRRCGLRHKQQALGKTAFDLFPRLMAERYAQQDQTLFRTGRAIVDNLDLTLYADGSPGWCLSSKTPLHDQGGRLVGLACISRDLSEPSREGLIDAKFAAAVDELLERYPEPFRVGDVAQRAGLSSAQFERRMKRVFGLTPAQYLIKLRTDQAARLLAETELPIAEIAQQSGFPDQSALSRRFRQSTGCTPGQYRQAYAGELRLTCSLQAASRR
ncbi:AraC family transcriptional regulator [Pseudomarimonas arenosa]|uniref:AraC family transcriptional regulator n=1 Tax=Pseudomarimonas arenosa TaxID=2774145 RepID=A0AAW3ZI40_9GAMM|nr:AraC family transcriptional regulator [Pseudomarimonas arenosa]MBD8525080.1 AraC family transcriptional regulator [Pseudomarimonas arenosa]